MTPSATLSFKNQFFASFYEAAELCKASDDGGLLILLELLNDRVANGLWTPGEEIAFTTRRKINSHSQIFRNG